MQTYQCSAKLADGNRCWRRVSAESEPAYCYQHDPAKKERERRLAALQAAVVAACKVWHAATLDPDHYMTNCSVLLEHMAAACAALAKAEKE